MHVFEHSCGGKGGGEGGGGDGGGEGGGSCATQTLLSSSSSVAIEPRMELARRPAGSERASDKCASTLLFFRACCFLASWPLRNVHVQ